MTGIIFVILLFILGPVIMGMLTRDKGLIRAWLEVVGCIVLAFLVYGLAIFVGYSIGSFMGS